MGEDLPMTEEIAAPIRLRRPPLWDSSSMLIPMGAVLVGLAVAQLGVRVGWLGEAWEAFALAGGIGLVLGAAAMALYAHLRPSALREIRFGNTSVRMPAGYHSPRMLDVAYPRIFGFERMGKRRWPRVLIGVRGRLPVGYLERAFEQPEDAERLLDELRRRIAELADGVAQLRGIEARHRIHERAFTGAWPVTSGIAFLLLAVFGIEMFAGAPGNAVELARLGAQVPLLVKGGEWWRIATGSLLHANLIHLYLNGLALLALGFILERLVGSVRFAWVLLWSALGGGIASTGLGDHLVSVGFSGALFGLFGTWITVNTLHRDALPVPIWLPAWYAVLIVVFELVLEAVLPNVDRAAHVGGFVAGIVATAVALPGHPLERALAHTPRFVPFATAILAAAFVASVGIGVESLLREGEQGVTKLAARFVAEAEFETSDQASTLNDLCWILATNPTSTRESLALPIERMQAVLARHPDNPAYLDTLATLHYRAGDPLSAVHVERMAFALKPGDFYASQIARFHAAQLASGNVVGAEEVHGSLPTFALVDAATEEPGERVLAVELGGALAQGGTLEALLWMDDAPSGLLRVVLGPENGPTARLTAKDGYFDRLPEGLRIQLALVDMRPPKDEDGTPTEAGHWSWRTYWMLKDVAQLP
jgi:membrane associated rhomboid family serine protease